jgi:hypothetical protein
VTGFGWFSGGLFQVGSVSSLMDTDGSPDFADRECAVNPVAIRPCVLYSPNAPLSPLHEFALCPAIFEKDLLDYMSTKAHRDAGIKPS